MCATSGATNRGSNLFRKIRFWGGGSDSLSWISLIYSYAYMSSKRRVGRPRGKGTRKRASAGPPLPEEVVQDPGSADRAAGLLLSGEVAPELGLAGGPPGLPLTGEVAGQLALAGEPAGLPPTEEVAPRAGAGLLPTEEVAPQHVPQSSAARGGGEGRARWTRVARV